MLTPYQAFIQMIIHQTSVLHAQHFTNSSSQRWIKTAFVEDFKFYISKQMYHAGAKVPSSVDDTSNSKKSEHILVDAAMR